MEAAWSAASNFDKGIHVRGSKTTRHASFRWKPKAGIDLIVNCDGVRDTIIVNVSWGGGGLAKLGNILILQVKLWAIFHGVNLAKEHGCLKIKLQSYSLKALQFN